MNIQQPLDGLSARVPLPVPFGVLLVVTLGAVGIVRLLTGAISGADAPAVSFLLLAGAGLYVAVLTGLVREFGWGWYGTIVVHMLFTLEAAVRYDVVAVVCWFLTVEYLYDAADRYVDIEEFSLFHASA